MNKKMHKSSKNSRMKSNKSRLKIQKNKRWNWLVILIAVFLIIGIYTQYRIRSHNLTQNAETAKIVGSPEPAVIDLIVAGKTLPMSDTPEATAQMAAYRVIQKAAADAVVKNTNSEDPQAEVDKAIANAQKTAATVATQAVKENVQKLNEIAKSKPALAATNVDIDATVNDAIKVVSDVKFIAITNTDNKPTVVPVTSTGNQPTRSYLNVFRGSTTRTRISKAVCDIGNNYKAPPGSVIRSGDKCQECLSVTASKSSSGVLKDVSCASVPAGSFVGVTDGSSGVSDDCVYYSDPANNKPTITKPNNYDGAIYYALGDSSRTSLIQVNISGKNFKYKCEAGQWQKK